MPIAYLDHRELEKIGERLEEAKNSMAELVPRSYYISDVSRLLHDVHALRDNLMGLTETIARMEGVGDER
jgi:hypothetical protein